MIINHQTISVTVISGVQMSVVKIFRKLINTGLYWYSLYFHFYFSTLYSIFFMDNMDIFEANQERKPVSYALYEF